MTNGAGQTDSKTHQQEKDQWYALRHCPCDIIGILCRDGCQKQLIPHCVHSNNSSIPCKELTGIVWPFTQRSLLQDDLFQQPD